MLDATGNDITNIPLPPTGLRTFATSGGGIRVEWWYPATPGPRAPTGFHVYASGHASYGAVPNIVVPGNSAAVNDGSVTATGKGATPNYSTPAATVLYSAGIFNTFQSNLDSLSDGIQYTVGVRAFNASGEEQNTTVVTVTADATGPAAVDSLTATAIV